MNKKFVIQNGGHSIMTKDIDSITYQKVVADMTVAIPPGNEMIVQSKANGTVLWKHCILTPEAKLIY